MDIMLAININTNMSMNVKPHVAPSKGTLPVEVWIPVFGNTKYALMMNPSMLIAIKVEFIGATLRNAMK